MSLGIELSIGANTISAAPTSPDDWYLINFSSQEGAMYCVVQEIMKGKIFHYSIVNQEDKITLNLKNSIVNSACISYDGYADFLKSIQHEGAGLISNYSKDQELNSLGVSIHINEEKIDVPFINNCNVNLGVNLAKDKADINLSAWQIGLENNNRMRKVWLDRVPLIAGDKITVEIAHVPKETPWKSSSNI